MWKRFHHQNKCIRFPINSAQNHIQNGLKADFERPPLNYQKIYDRSKQPIIVSRTYRTGNHGFIGNGSRAGKLGYFGGEAELWTPSVQPTAAFPHYFGTNTRRDHYYRASQIKNEQVCVFSSTTRVILFEAMCWHNHMGVVCKPNARPVKKSEWQVRCRPTLFDLGLLAQVVKLYLLFFSHGQIRIGKF